MNLKSEVELVKVQVFANYCESQYTVGISASFAGYLGILLALLQYVYQYFGEKQFGLTMVGYLSLIFGGVILFIFFMGFLFIPISKTHELDIDGVQSLLEQIEKGETLFTLSELKKQRKDRGKRKRI
jgi:hypothetical protein